MTRQRQRAFITCCPSMRHLVTEQQAIRYEEFKAFVALNVEPFTEQWDRDQSIPDSTQSLLAKSGFFGCSLPTDFGGKGWDTVTFGLLNEAFGNGSSALTDFLTVQAMVSMSILKWGSQEQKWKWLPPLANGEVIGAFALTEPGAGSDIQSLVTELTRQGDHFILNGSKKWISCSQIAGLFLVFGKLEQHSVACLVDRNTPGVTIEPIYDLMGFRGAGLADIHFNEVEVPANNLVGKPGFALSHVAAVGLQYGRLSTACSGLGLLRGCLEQSVAYAAERKIGDRTLGELGMIRSLIAQIATDFEAGNLLCHYACQAQDDHLPEAIEKTVMAKYFTSKAAVRASSNAVQIRGASGCHASSPVSRYYRDAKIMEIIEGTTQVHEDMLGRMLVDQVRRFQCLPQ